jgi:hypothetical protein
VFRSELKHTVAWYANDTRLSTSSKYEIANDESSTSLILRNVEANDQREYKCVISNEHDTVTYKTYLFVDAGKKVVEVVKPTAPVAKKPEIKRPLEPVVKASIGDNVRLSCECESAGQHGTKVEWFFGKANITDKIGKSTERYVYEYDGHTHTSTLVIKTVKSKDKGEYTFSARSSQGVCTSTCRLEVAEPLPRVKPAPVEKKSPVVKQLEPQQSVKQGETAK